LDHPLLTQLHLRRVRLKARSDDECDLRELRQFNIAISTSQHLTRFYRTICFLLVSGAVKLSKLTASGTHLQQQSVDGVESDVDTHTPPISLISALSILLRIAISEKYQ
jgi:hypothetical protein